MRKRKTLLIAVGIAILSVIMLIVFILLTKGPKENVVEENINVEELEMDFNKLFDNQENEYVKTLYHLDEEKSGKYKINVDIPYVSIQTEVDNKINKEINDLFVNKLIEIINGSESYTILKMDYTTNVNENIISLAIRCVLKEGSNAQRTIIKTYNYDIETEKELNIMEIVPEDKEEDIQNQINQEIQKQIRKEETIAEQGYKGIYRRDKDSQIYILKNATEFYLKDKILYIIYSYGNSSYTSETDLIINKI